jgi:hypothetical protein
MPHFVLDQNFPWYVVSFPWPSDIRITRLPDHAPDLVQNVDDWEVFLGLSKRGDVDGFITNDANILLQATEMVALTRTRLTLVITDGVGHEPLRATGLVMLHLEEVVRRMDGTAQVFVIRPGPIGQRSPNREINRIAQFHNQSPGDLFASELLRIQPRLT